ncbi:uncharacterized protein ARB_06971 [Trichophyton benhamiae CBS 112371]|uniref:Uncharacterized protein n=1 Tax=Arthroderma benhamiae (strain ATCC MYA-4681 / CBS 112371) TaxID=663331 RepID=D4ARV6_ARTBC|nr:uncharacterized protein ARB_06971 [Trichophyton benhamiae CBS 112371]EFE34020.1 hypothetical protein ARB_06971 [Trichophyton benhamiae CBS 112371]
MLAAGGDRVNQRAFGHHGSQEQGAVSKKNKKLYSSIEDSLPLSDREEETGRSLLSAEIVLEANSSRLSGQAHTFKEDQKMEEGKKKKSVKKLDPSNYTGERKVTNIKSKGPRLRSQRPEEKKKSLRKKKDGPHWSN